MRLILLLILLYKCVNLWERSPHIAKHLKSDYYKDINNMCTCFPLRQSWEQRFMLSSVH